MPVGSGGGVKSVVVKGWKLFRFQDRPSLLQAPCQCERLKKRAGDERGLVGKKRCPSPFLPRIPLVACSLFRSSSLTESLEQAKTGPTI